MLQTRDFAGFHGDSSVSLHDRNLRIDDAVFFLGTSIKDAGTQPTNFTPANSTPTGHAVLDGIMAKGTLIS
jgi:hypothetical protein